MLATLVLQQFQYHEAVKIMSATVLIQIFARGRTVRRLKKPPSPTSEERQARVVELATQEAAGAERKVLRAVEALAAANCEKETVAREAEIAAAKVAKTEAVAARAQSRFTRVKSKNKVMRMFSKGSAFEGKADGRW